MIVALSLAFAAMPAAEAQPEKVRKIGWLSYAAPMAKDPWWVVPIWEGLRDRGWVEGQNLIIERRYSNDQPERASALAAELVQLKVDVILVLSTPVAVAAQRATTRIPIVFANVGDPVGSGLIKSFARPGGNLTGLGGVAAGLVGKMLQLLKETVPGATRIAVVWNPAVSWHAEPLNDVQERARRLGLALDRVELRSPDELEGAFASLARQRPQGVVVFGQPFMVTQTYPARIAKVAADHRLPAIHMFAEVVKAGGLMSYGTQLIDTHRRIPYYIDRILRGDKPNDLPVEQPMRFYLTINLSTAKALGLTFPASMLARADEVIE